MCSSPWGRSKTQTPNPRTQPQTGIWSLGFGIWDLCRALPVHDDRIECLAFAEVDEVVCRCLIRVQLDKIFQTLRSHGGADASIERAELFGFALPLLAIQLDKAAGGFRDAARGNLRDNLAEVRPLVSDAAA